MKMKFNVLFIVVLFVLCAVAFADPAAETAKTDAAAPGPFANIPVPETEPAKLGDRLVSMSFNKADIASVLQFLSMASEIPIVCDAEIKGTVTIINLQQIPLKHAFEVINSALRTRGYTMIGSLDTDLIRVVTLKKAVSDKIEVRYGADVSAMDSNDTVITQIIPLQFVAAAKLKEELKPLVSDDQGSMMSSTTSNTLIITDTAGNVRRIAQVIKQLDKDTSDVIEVEVYTCKFSSADSLYDSINKVFQLPTTTPRTPNPQQGGQPNPGAPPAVMGADGGLISMKGEIRIAADTRTNSLVISAARPKINLVLNMIKKLDVDTTPEVKAKVFPLKYADAKIVADQLNKLFEQPQGGVSSANRFPWMSAPNQGRGNPAAYAGMKRNIVVADIRTNSVVVTATEQNLREFETMIGNLDTPKVLSEVTHVYSLKYAKAADLANTMNRLFRGNTQRSGGFFDFFTNAQNQEGSPLTDLRSITLVAEEKSNSLLVTGPPRSFTLVESMISQLDKQALQVFIEVAIVDVTLDDTTKFGVEWSWANAHNNISTNFGLTDETKGLKYSVISGNLKALLHALETRSNVKVYSTPTITTADNVQAKISIGSDVPFVSSETQDNSGNFRRSVEFKNVAISLTVTPHVNDASNTIALDVYQTINELIGTEPELNAPIIANREAKTSVMVSDHQTIVIGGIIKDNHERSSSGVPFLSRIPVLGNLFKTNKIVNQKSELMVFLTPHILRNDTDVKATETKELDKLSDPGRLTAPGGPLTDPKTPASDEKK
ncbi:MAG: secretin N-terminal domain-containing protein [Armatimonadota bacterium]